MKKLIPLFLFAIVMSSCDQDTESKSLVGLWNLEKVYFNGINSDVYLGDMLSNNNFLDISKDKTFHRAYDVGKWQTFNNSLVLDRDETFGSDDWSYVIIEQTKTRLVLEVRLTINNYCCGTDAFGEDEVVVIREFYSRVDL